MSETVENFEIRLMAADDEPGLMDFLRGNLDSFEEFERFWKWRQDNVSESGGEEVAIALEGDNVVGSVGIVPAFVTANGYPIRAAWQQDSLVSSDMRGRGLGKKLVEKAAEGYDLVIAKGTSEAMYGLRKSLGFKDVPISDYLLRVNKPRFKKKNKIEVFVECILYIWNFFLPRPKIIPDRNVQVVNKFDDSFNTLADVLSKENTLRIYKNRDYLNWRYTDCPEKKYQILRLGHDRAEGAIILSVAGTEFDEGWIVDLICPTQSKNCAYTLIANALAFFEKKRVTRIWVFTTLPGSRKWFYRFGFLPTGRTPRFTYKGKDGCSISDDSEKFSWDFWHGDGDLELYQ